MRSMVITGLLVALPMLAAPAQAQSPDQAGPMVPPPKFEVHRIPSVPHPGPPPIPAEEIIQRFAANEDVMEKIYKTYTFEQTIRIEEMGGTGGKFTAIGQVYTKPDGGQFWRVTRPLQSDLKTTTITLDDVRSIETIPLFVLTSKEIGDYNFLYAGQDKLDELNTYVFQVKPKQLSRTRRFFDGVIWVDDHDFAIVKSYGKFVSEIAGNGLPLPFTMFETYRENFQEKYWLPTYTNSDDFITTQAGGQVHLRLVIHSQDFKLISPANTAAPASTTEKPPSGA